jgi:hypothetical protein
MPSHHAGLSRFFIKRVNQANPSSSIGVFQQNRSGGDISPGSLNVRS